MSERSMLDRYLDSRDGQEPSREHGPEDCGAFGQLRGIQSRATMLELRRKDGTIRAIGYGWLERIEYDPDEGITIHAAGQVIRIKGRNLNFHTKSLYQSLVRHKAVWIQESTRAETMSASEPQSLVAAIEW